MPYNTTTVAGLNLIVPTIHMNGTSKGALLDGVEEVGKTLRDAIYQLDHAGPNGRDYYPQGPEAITIAQAQHASRLSRLRSVLAEVEAIGEAISDAAHMRA